MKTVSTFIGLLLLSGVALASSTLNLAINGGNSYTVYLDGKQYQTSRDIRFQNLFPGRHTLSVIKKQNATFVYNGFIDVEDNQVLFGTVTNGNLSISNHQQNNYQNDYNSGNNHNDYDNSTYNYEPAGSNNHHHGMSQSVFDQLHHDLSYSTDYRKGRMIVNKAQRHGISSNQVHHLLSEFSIDSHRLSAAKQLTSYVVDRENFWTVGQTFTFASNKNKFLRHINRGSCNSNIGSGNNGGCGTIPNIPRPRPQYNSYGMNQQSFQVLKNAVRSESFDNNKKTQIISVVRNSRISAQQMTELLKEFTFDNNRLATAKSVIPYVSDKRNYWMAGETFTFSNNKNSFLKALN